MLDRGGSGFEGDWREMEERSDGNWVLIDTGV